MKNMDSPTSELDFPKVENPEQIFNWETNNEISEVKEELTKLSDLVVGKNKHERIDQKYSGRYTEIQEGTLSPLVAGSLLLHDPSTSPSLTNWNDWLPTKAYIEGVSVEDKQSADGNTINTEYKYNNKELVFGKEQKNWSFVAKTDNANIQWWDRGIADQKILANDGKEYRLAKIPTGQGVAIDIDGKLQSILWSELKKEFLSDFENVKAVFEEVQTARNKNPKKTLEEICQIVGAGKDIRSPEKKAIDLIGALPLISDAASFARIIENITFLGKAKPPLYERINYALILLKDDEFINEKWEIEQKTIIEKVDINTTLWQKYLRELIMKESFFNSLQEIIAKWEDKSKSLQTICWEIDPNWENEDIEALLKISNIDTFASFNSFLDRTSIERDAYLEENIPSFKEKKEKESEQESRERVQSNSRVTK